MELTKHKLCYKMTIWNVDGVCEVGIHQRKFWRKQNVQEIEEEKEKRKGIDFLALADKGLRKLIKLVILILIGAGLFIGVHKVNTDPVLKEKVISQIEKIVDSNKEKKNKEHESIFSNIDGMSTETLIPEDTGVQEMQEE